MALLEKRRQLVGDVNQLHEGVVDRGGAGHGSGGPAAAPSDLADRGSDEWEQSFSFGLIENKEALLRDIDAALERMCDGTYGVCVATGKPISKARLRLMPWAQHCIEYARQREGVRR